ncbi:MAG: DUF2202 domain-containing protein [Phaeodactylibacter sp.]|uniref:DUF2202 domain-containing protein n=1 Tax=Phaeodactylibacter sp. TaxID=1940289 RepID=UPI0032EEF719
MKNRIWKSIVLTTLLLGTAFVFTQCETDVTGPAPEELTVIETRGAATTVAADLCNCLNEKFPTEALSEAEAGALVFMREEEKLARDVYLSLFERWETRVFSNIAKSEQQHMDAVLCLIEKYELQDPVGTNPTGVFQNENLQALYTTLTETGSESLEAAFIVGATIEDLDINDLNQEIATADNEDLIAVFNELNRGSRNHLRAFMKNLTNIGATYAPQYISEDLFAEITLSETERGSSLNLVCGIQAGNGQCPGTCNGNGQQQGGQQGNCNGTGNGPGNGTGICDGNGGNGNGGNGNGGNGNGGNGNGGNGNGGNGNGGNGNGGNGNGGNGNGGNGNGGN